MTRTLTTETIKLWRNNAGITAGETAEDDPEHIAAKAILALTAEILANREAQPFGYVYTSKDGVAVNFGYELPFMPEKWNVTPVYTAQPAPAVPGIDELRLTFERAERESDDGFNLHKYGIGYADEATQARWESWLACRAAMLTEAKCECSSIDYCENCLRAMLTQPVSQGYTLPEGGNDHNTRR
ncbi:hypothetical protein NOY08_002536 [Serratia marcescens]